MPQQTVIEHARTVIEIETAAIRALSDRIDEQFEKACDMVLSCQGRVVVIGMGKSGHIGGKIAATLASTGTPSFFVHPGEASHGDLGMITPDDLVIMISNSGETTEIVSIVPIVKRLGVKMIAFTGKPISSLGRLSDACLDVSVDMEACPHNLAPTASTTATPVMGDALAVVVQRSRGFSANDFARTHPGGTLGKRLLLYASDIMHSEDEVPLVDEGATMHELLLEMTTKSLGMVGVINTHGQLLGMFTDGDLRRILNQKIDIYEIKAVELMSPDPLTIHDGMLAEEIVKLMREHAQHGLHAINSLFVLDKDKRVVGALNTYDLLRVGVI